MVRQPRRGMKIEEWIHLVWEHPLPWVTYREFKANIARHIVTQCSVPRMAPLVETMILFGLPSLSRPQLEDLIFLPSYPRSVFDVCLVEEAGEPCMGMISYPVHNGLPYISWSGHAILTAVIHTGLLDQSSSLHSDLLPISSADHHTQPSQPSIDPRFYQSKLRRAGSDRDFDCLTKSTFATSSLLIGTFNRPSSIVGDWGSSYVGIFGLCESVEGEIEDCLGSTTIGGILLSPFFSRMLSHGLQKGSSMIERMQGLEDLRSLSSCVLVVLIIGNLSAASPDRVSLPTVLVDVGSIGVDQLVIKNKGVERVIAPEFLDNLDNGLLTSNASKNTVLHLVSKIGNVACIDYLLKKDPSRIRCRNSDTETPVYVAAREGRTDILQYMIDFVKKQNKDIESIVTRSFDKNNALHIAIQNDHLEAVFLLIKEIPQLSNRINKSNESPLYHAAKGGHFRVVNLLLKCTGVNFQGPNRETALHAASIANSPECAENLLKANGGLLTVQDNRGWTAFCHAIYHNSWLVTKKLLEADYSIGYHEFIKEKSVKTSAIHFAASLGHCKTMEVLMELCPGCSDFIDSDGRNILHVAVQSKKNETIEFLLRDESLTNLINQRDKHEKTPIDLLDACDFEKMKTLKDSSGMISSYDQRRRLIKAINTSTHDKTSTLPPKLVNKSELKGTESEAIEKQANTHFVIVDSLSVVAALIATASFAAAFTVPGGLDSSNGSKQGTPLLLREPAFKAFIILNAIAFSLSCCSLLRYIELLRYRDNYDQLSFHKQEHVDRKIMDMYLLTTVALVAMTVAFVTGLYVVLKPSPGLAIFVCALTLLIRGIYHIISWRATWMLPVKEKKTLT
ncbi:hypothetical protein E3N88_18730 [Mikania micrantha]|uniref:PGG domain-containing protein n=1 Tax=Mikania micrantha TaxID=192012 RepID=A0A5N6NLR1_9ASTR|nr:hypothetical protein E3N88_18730 [Mikania micrantha]